MLEQFQTILDQTIAVQGDIVTFTREEQAFISEFPGQLAQASIGCMDGFYVPIAVNRDNLVIIDSLPIPGQVEDLHKQFHNAVGHEYCEGLRYFF
jgi:hypothetical protein